MKECPISEAAQVTNGGGENEEIDMLPRRQIVMTCALRAQKWECERKLCTVVGHLVVPGTGEPAISFNASRKRTQTCRPFYMGTATSVPDGPYSSRLGFMYVSYFCYAWRAWYSMGNTSFLVFPDLDPHAFTTFGIITPTH